MFGGRSWWILFLFLVSCHLEFSSCLSVDGVIWQDNPLAGLSNKIYVTLSFNESVPSGAIFTISGLTGATIASPVPLTTSNAGTGTDASTYFACGANTGYGCWSSVDNSMTLQLKQAISANVVYSFSFVVQNGATEQGSPQIYFKYVEVYNMTTKTDSAYGVTSGSSILLIVIPAFTVKTIVQETFLQGLENAITATLQTNVALTAQTSVIITGLKPTGNLSKSSLTLAGACSSTFDGPGAFNPSTGTLTLTVSPSGFTSNTLCTLSFSIQNPRFAVSPPSLSISASGNVSIATSTFDQTGVDPDYLPLFVLGFVKKQVQQSNPSISASNTITVTFSLNREIKQQVAVDTDKITSATFTLTGLTGSSTPDATSLTVSSSNFSISDTTWTQSTGTLRFKPSADLAAFQDYEIHFSLLNPSYGQDARNVTITLEAIVPVKYGSKSAVLAVESLSNGQGNFATLLVADFLVKFLSQSDPSARAINKLIFTFSSSIDMAAAGARINITGFDNATSASEVLTLTDESAAVGGAASSNMYFSSSFGGTASTALFSNGILSLYVVGSIKARSTYSIGFSIQNPSVGQFSPSFYIRSIGEYAATATLLVGKAQGNNEPLLIAGFQYAQVYQSEQSAGAPNLLIVSFSPYTEVVAGSQLNLLNLVGANSSDGVIPLTDDSANSTCVQLGNCALHFTAPKSNMSGYGLWTRSPPSLTLQVVSTINQSEIVSFSFTVVNSKNGQRPPSISLSYTGTISSSSFVAATSEGPAAALRIAGFNYSFMSQYQTGATEINFFNLTFQNYAVLFANQTVITVSGLLNTLDFDPPDQRTLKEEPLLQGTLKQSTNEDILFLDQPYSLSFSPVGYLLQIGSETRSIVSFSSAYTVKVSSRFDAGISQSTSTSYSILSDSLSYLYEQAAWNTTAGELYISVKKDIPLERYLKLSFQLKNPTEPQDAAIVYISSSGVNLNDPVASSKTTVQNAPGRFAPLFIIGFFYTKMFQSTTEVNANNKITAIFSTTVNLAASLSTKIWITNLTATQTPSSSSFPVTGSPAGVFSPTASWTQDVGILTIDVIGEQADVLVYTLEFVLKNPPSGQDEPSVSIFATGTTISPIKFDYEVGNFAPLRIGYFTSLLIAQETPSASDWDIGGEKISNSLSVSFASNLVLTAVNRSTTLFISGIAPLIAATGTIIKSLSASSFQLDDSASSSDAAYNKFTFRIRDQSVVISSYIGSTRTVYLQQNLDFIPLDGTDRFIIQNLQNFTVPLTHNYSEIARSASYSPTAQELAVTFLEDTVRKQRYSFSFLLLNPPEGQLSPDISISTAGFVIPWTRMEKGASIYQPLLIAGFVSPPTLRQNNPNSGETNKFSISMLLFSPIAADSVLVISDFHLLDPAGTVVDLVTNEDTTCGNVSCAFSFSRVFFSSASSDVNNTFNDSLPGTAGWNGSHLLLHVINELPSLETTADPTIVLSFFSQNPVLGQWSVDAQIKILGANSQVAQTAFSKTGDNSDPFLIAGFSVATAAQSTPSSGGQNNITLLLQSYVDLDENSSLVVTGFSLPHYNASLIALSLYDTQATKAGSLFSALLQTQEGTLNISIKKGQRMLSGVNYTIMFPIINPVPPQYPPTLSVHIVGKVRSAPVELSSPLLDFSPLFIAGFRTKYMQQSSSSTDDVNSLTTTISTTTMLYKGTRITIKGLVETGADTVDGARPVSSTSSSIFATEAQWTKVNGTLVVTLADNMLPLLDYSFNFSVRNPKQGQPGPALLIQATGLVNVGWVNVDSRNDSFKPLYISDLVDILISQSTTSSSARNTLTMILSLEAPLLPGFAEFQVSGLLGSTTPSGLLNISSDVAREGNWTRSSGTLLFGLTVEMQPYTNYTFTFQLDNPAQGQESPSVSIEVLKTLDLDPRYWSAYKRRMRYDSVLNSAPLLVAGLLSSSIQQTNPCCSAPNRLSMTFSSRTLLHQGCSLTVSGLLNALHDGSVIDIQQHISNSTDDSLYFTANMSSNLSGSGLWLQQEDAKVVLYLTQDIHRNQTISFSFTVQNPSTGQSSPDVAMEANGEDCAITKTLISKSSSNPPLLIAGFSLLSIQQSSFSQGASNVITVALSPYVSIASPADLYFYGLQGASAPPGVINLLDSSPSTVCVDEVQCYKFFDVTIFGDGLAKAVWLDADKTLQLRSNRLITPQMTVKFSWVLTNELAGQSSPQVFAAGSSGNCSLGITPFTSPAGDQQVLLIADVVDSLVSQSTPINSAVNTITVRLSFNFNLGQQDFSVLTLSGLGASSSDDGFLPISSPTNQSWPALGAIAHYKSATSSVVMNISNVRSFTNYSFSFNLSNPSAGQLAPVIVLNMSGAATIINKVLKNDLGTSAPFFVYGFIEKSGAQSSALRDATNSISIYLTSTVLIPSGTKIVLEGIKETNSLATTLNVLMNASSAYSITADWNISGTLSLTTSADVQEFQPFLLTFQVNNPSLPQAAPPIFISSSGSDPSSTFLPTLLDSFPLPNSQILQIMGFIEAAASQTNPSVLALNVITLTFSMYASLDASSHVTITGLAGSFSNSSIKVPVIELTGHFATYGLWNESKGSLVLTAATWTLPGLLYNFTFELYNPQAGRPAAAIEIESDWPIPRYPVTPAAGSKAPFLIQEFTVREMYQVNPGVSQWNLITVTIQSRTELRSFPAEISIVSPGRGYVPGDLLPLPSGAGSGFRATFDVGDAGEISQIRILDFGEGYNESVQLYPMYPNTSTRMDQTVTAIIVAAGGVNYVEGEVYGQDTIVGSGKFLGIALVNQAGSISEVRMVDHGSNFQSNIFNINLRYTDTKEVMTNSISSVDIIGPTASCLVGTVIVASSSSGRDFKAEVDAIDPFTGEILSLKIIAHGIDYLSTPYLYSETAGCFCTVSPVNSSLLDKCLVAKRAHNASFFATVGLDADVQGFTPTIKFSGLEGYPLWTTDNMIPINKVGGTGVLPTFGQYMKWDEVSGELTLVVKSTMLADVSYAFEFLVMNPSAALDSPTLYIQSTGIASSPAIVNSSAGIHIPFLTAGFYTNQSLCWQTDPGQNTSNMLTVSLLSRSDLPLIPASFNLSSGGINYIAGDLVIDGYNTSDFLANFDVDVNGTISRLYLRWVSDSFAWSAGLQLSIVYPGTFTPQGSTITSILLVSGGSGLDPPDGTYDGVVNSLGVDGNGFAWSYTVQGGRVVSAEVKSGGSGYLVSKPPTLLLNNVHEGNSNNVKPVMVVRCAGGAQVSLLPAAITISGLVGTALEAKSMPITQKSGNGISIFDASAGWNRTAGLLVLSLVKPVLKDVDYTIMFTVINGLSKQEPPPIFVSGQTGISLARLQLSTLPGRNSQPLLIAGVYLASVSQSNPGQGAFNTISISVTFNFDVFPLTTPTNLTISGLSGTSFPSMQTMVFSSGVTDSNGYWNSSGQLLVQFVQPVSAGFSFSLQFGLNNPLKYQDAVDVYLATSGVRTFPALLTPGKGLYAPLYIIGFRHAKLYQSDPSVSSTNTLVLELNFFGSIPANWQNSSIQILLSNLVSSATRLQNIILSNVRNGGADLFGGVARWSQGDGNLTLTLVQSPVDNVTYAFSFSLTNPVRQQESPAVSIAAFGLTVLPLEVSKGQGNAAPLLIAGFDTKSISQSTVSQAVDNQITVSFSLNIDLSAISGVYVEVSGLVGSSTLGDQNLAVSSPNASALASTASWLQNEKIRVALLTDLNRQKVVIFTVTLRNPLVPNSATPVYISVSSAGKQLCMSEMEAGTGNKHPLLIAGFSYLQLGQSNADVWGFNELTVTLSLNCDLTFADGENFLLLTGLARDVLLSLSTVPVLHISNFASSNSSAYFDPYLGGLRFNFTRQTAFYAQLQYVFRITVVNSQSVLRPSQLFLASSGKIIVSPSLVVSSPGITAYQTLASFAQDFAATCVIDGTWTSKTAGSWVGRRDFAAVQRNGMPIVTDHPEIFGFEALWTQTDGRLIVQTSWQGAMERGGVYSFSFTLLNPSKVQAASEISIFVDGPDPIWNETMTLGVDGNGQLDPSRSPLKTVTTAWLAANISQNSSIPGHANLLTVTFASWTDIPAGSAISLVGLTGSSTSDTSSLPLVQVGGFLLGSAAWAKQQGQLVVYSSTKLNATVVHSFSFVLQNGPTGQTARSVSISVAGADALPAVAMQTDFSIPVPPGFTALDLAPLRILGSSFLIKSIGQTASYPAALNSIVITLMTSVDLNVGVRLTISGLTGSSTPDSTLNASFPLVSPPLFSSGVWTRAVGVIVFTLTEPIVAGVSYSFSFKLQNPSTAQSSPSVYIVASSSIVTSALMDKDTTSATAETGTVAGDASPLKVYGPSFIVKRIEQSTTFPSSSNFLLASFALNSAITTSDRTFIHLRGFQGAATPSASGYTVSSSSPVIQGSGTWSNSGAALPILEVDLVPNVTLPAGTLVNFTFSLLNPSSEQPSSPVTITLTQYQWTSLMDVNSSKVLDFPGSVPGDAVPLKVNSPALIVSKIAQSSPFPDDSNTLVVSLAANVDLYASSTVDIYGLYGSASPDGPLEIAYEGGKTTFPVFGSTCMWYQSVGRLTLEVGFDQMLVAGQLVVLNVTLLNPGSANSESVVYAEVQAMMMTTNVLVSITLPSVMMGTDSPSSTPAYYRVGDNLPFRVYSPGFQGAQIQQNSTLPRASNRISTQFVSNEPCSSTTNITIVLTGLIGSNTTSTSSFSVSLSEDGGTAIATSSCSWTQQTGTLQFMSLGDIVPGLSYTFSFILRNPSRAQDPPASVQLLLQCGVFQFITNPGVDVDCISTSSLQDCSPLYVKNPSFLIKTIVQSSPVINQLNVITVTLSPNIDLPPALRITISGLKASASPDSEEIVVTGGYRTDSTTSSSYTFFSDVRAFRGGSFSIIANSSTWPARDGHSLLNHQGSLLIMGGWGGPNGGGYLNDVWRSRDDGATWSVVTSASSWNVRGYFASLILEDRLYVFGGQGFASGRAQLFNDVWSSTDGLSWTSVTSAAAWSPRFQHGLIKQILNGRKTLFLTAGISCSSGCTRYNTNLPGCQLLTSSRSSCCVQYQDCAEYKAVNDVYSSTDNGATWKLATASAAWAPRASFGFAADHNGTMYVYGGTSGVDTFYGDLWRSNDGVSWYQVQASVAVGSRAGGRLIATSQCLFYIGGWNRAGAQDYPNDLITP
ncbi:hypothetical protein GUITHDRAFT_139994 [Guillardia theta CCMP2712]|uniref:Uncharacterized protein n=1 Tax=Guillardia theta (strain CCMP2712) TaxID=905079 RepID=L1J6I6_GUITC|nr:hypothetical protein GUITHDRAFT_139994 [Guillardia theta CCMP2712]EKX44153.1 hypothetical protein GUITHDRAFT_139994 [Guillardia theta CCMP2712]|eukprot:XP_005831133.1 hypothetical protein GUITHDRAFT_139994 [Guillardia theta CCMP2712]